jgi:hypothetical protein
MADARFVGRPELGRRRTNEWCEFGAVSRHRASQRHTAGAPFRAPLLTGMEGYPRRYQVNARGSNRSPRCGHVDWLIVHPMILTRSPIGRLRVRDAVGADSRRFARTGGFGAGISPADHVALGVNNPGPDCNYR